MSATDDLRRRYTVARGAALVKAEGDGRNTDTSPLREFWTRGEGALVIEWDTPGALDRCEQLLDDYPINPASLCRSYFEDVHGHNRYAEDEVKPEGDDDEAPAADEPTEADEAPDDTEDDDDDDEPTDTRSRRERERDARRGRGRTGRGKSDDVPDSWEQGRARNDGPAYGGDGRPDSGSTLERGDMAMTRTKATPLTKIKAGADDNLGEGEFTAYASVFGNVDSYGDVVQPGAFTKSIADWAASGNSVPLLWGHDSKSPHSYVGEVLSMVEDGHGLKIRGKLDLDSDTGAQVYRLVKGRRVTQLSFAYDEVTTHPVKNDPALGNYKSLDVLHIHEVSLVPIGANRSTAVLAVKAAAEPTGPSVKAWEGYFTAARYGTATVPSR
ncbi:HK97 family phage prohead protease [Rhodococcus sp. IEGM 1401]|uniref:HK97 family phage prohead protease n=1 Tax=unclassified Rhodococcus (in: high G+C Gram-positive bacteria) TaxID=192944 RepID=UPI0022B5D930|nr:MULTISPECIES: HK97 family phage prohead protease [unclassified Rhodococcus (in: high G+C Gram-positive bacteria)]MCZ4559893.1 HK97 family phage prohead protease [Rhodococcus sp. IEGM 1401]MDI9920063.1 HK97 family phage prohead protease [Rhodococcus sp. IEGM 1372]MDV8032474.1 HK97 family phage prohead protease [Rhodococcus sp. IEGM 1414]